MAKQKRWFAKNEKVAANKVAKELGESMMEYVKTTREGPVKQYYVGDELPTAATKGEYHSKVVFTPK